jgi:hypothetical protein
MSENGPCNQSDDGQHIDEERYLYQGSTRHADGNDVTDLGFGGVASRDLCICTPTSKSGAGFLSLAAFTLRFHLGHYQRHATLDCPYNTGSGQYLAHVSSSLNVFCMQYFFCGFVEVVKKYIPF